MNTILNATANELQYLSNKANKQTETEFQNLIERLSFLCRITDIKIAWINLCIQYAALKLLLNFMMKKIECSMCFSLFTE